MQNNTIEGSPMKLLDCLFLLKKYTVVCICPTAKTSRDACSTYLVGQTSLFQAECMELIA